MNPQTTLPERRRSHTTPAGSEQAALRRVSAHINAEAAELPPNTWLAGRLDTEIDHWDTQLLPELERLMSSEQEPEASSSWARVRSDPCPLTQPEEACLRRIAAVLRAEADELGSASPVGARMDRLGIVLWLECEAPVGAKRGRVVP